MKTFASVKLVKDLCFLGGTEILFFWTQTQVEDNEGKPHIPAVRTFGVFFSMMKLVSSSTLGEVELKRRFKKANKKKAAFTLIIDYGIDTEDTIKKSSTTERCLTENTQNAERL